MRRMFVHAKNTIFVINNWNLLNFTFFNNLVRQRKINILLTFVLRQRTLNFNNFNRFIFQKEIFEIY